MCPLVCRTAKLNSKLSFSHLQQFLWDQTQINTRIEHLEAHASNPAGQFMPLIKYNPCDCFYLSTERVTMLTGFPRTRWPQWRFSESYAVQISVKLSRICEFLLGCCSSSTLGSRANDYVKYARVLTASFALLPRVLDEQHLRSPDIIPWLMPGTRIKWPTVCRWYFRIQFLVWKIMHFIHISPKYVPKDPLNIDSYNSMIHIGRKATIWTNGGLVFLYTYTSLCPDELN